MKVVHTPEFKILPMKKITFLLFLVLLLHKQKAQNNYINYGHGFGFQLSQYQNDFGFGVHYSSPVLFNSMGLRLKYNLMFHEHVKDSLTTWTPYSNFSLGLVGFAGMVTPGIRIYGEGGLLLLLPSSAFSSSKVNIGGYGTFGFEFFPYNSFNYFIELGGMGTGSLADKLPNQPIYSNGFSISTGFRIILP